MNKNARLRQKGTEQSLGYVSAESDLYQHFNWLKVIIDLKIIEPKIVKQKWKSCVICGYDLIEWREKRLVGLTTLIRRDYWMEQK